ncbi:hypothetical protein FDE29_24080 [Vibrio parahaemolyticus]|uniref:hypothetical protein n=1 Tax=Vibrio harveyi group TaxID=717610 RepID=UPI0004044C79|nr:MULTISPECIES: hypothetical protein [Vibrio harveyi group]EGR0439595.1 hypothetical protein [Vibrio parahaemolyticus]EGR0766569.1 hypothetical protein [Vibrio parahaemolyticus]EGR2568484.1 hypothetical protein [Vibrio parahaemolyticus]EGR3330527.1 hypothetical protein [Vibrio parahaemolyticus]EHK9610707.1 hypothetical protein [Vibrio parahaemolyticus]
MSLVEVFELAAAVIASIGGAGAVLFGLSGWLGKVYLQKEKAKLEKLQSKYSLVLEKERVAHQRYSESQFKTYNEVWAVLCEVERVCENLWVKARPQDVRILARTIKEARQQLKSGALLFEESDYKLLNDLFDDFGNFQFGKHRLAELRQNQTGYYDDQDVYTLIENNREIRERYQAVLSRIKNDFRSQIRGERL